MPARQNKSEKDPELMARHILLALDGNQISIKQNFRFWKDPVTVNSVFLRKPTPVEGLGLVVVALLLRRLIERCKRLHWKEREVKSAVGTSVRLSGRSLS
jgi:hypothetical protein